MEKILITICARGGSKGIPGKNIKSLNGIPLIGYSIKTAKEFALKENATIVVSSDDSDILNIASRYGIFNLHNRSIDLATDSAGKVEVITTVLEHMEGTKNICYDYILDLDVTSPLRTYEDLVQGLKILRNSDGLNLFSVNQADRNPYFNMVEKDTDGFYKISKQLGEDIKTRQSAPKVYSLNASFYWYKRKFFEEGYSTVLTERAVIFEMPHICFDLDHVIDFEFMEFLLINKKLPWFQN